MKMAQTTLALINLCPQKEDPSSKSVVFSRFRKILLLLEGPLKREGFNILHECDEEARCY
jgi:SWI/SNF-related matrix-associated actin-dependent regulator of chromatin subfamily A3